MLVLDKEEMDMTNAHKMGEWRNNKYIAGKIGKVAGTRMT